MHTKESLIQQLANMGLTGEETILLAQIDEKRYDAEMREEKITDILKFGIAFSGKQVSVKTE